MHSSTRRKSIKIDIENKYLKELKRLREADNKIFKSMSRKGNCFDNVPIENFFGLMKQVLYYGYIYLNYEELKQLFITICVITTKFALKKNWGG